jgi:hypothetical protein
MVSFKSNVDFEQSNQILAISVGHYSQGNLHNKILYNFENTIKEIHLGWHHYFKHTDIRFPESYIWEVPRIPKSRLKSVIARCIIVSEDQLKTNKKPLPYAAGYHSSRLFDEEGIYSDDESKFEYGMTCATFVLTIFKSVGIDILDWSNWVARADDTVWFNHIISVLEKGCSDGQVSVAHLNNVRKEINCARFRPEEIFGSMYCTTIPPSSFECTVDFGIIVKKYVTSLPPEYCP